MMVQCSVMMASLKSSNAPSQGQSAPALAAQRVRGTPLALARPSHPHAVALYDATGENLKKLGMLHEAQPVAVTIACLRW